MMKTLISSAAALVAMAILAPTTASADWRDSTFGMRSQFETSSAPAARSTRQAASRPARAARTTSDEERPQRRAAVSRPAPSSFGGGESGIASYYWQPQPVASGGRFNPYAMTAAHKTLPFGTRVRVTRPDTGQSVEVTINDRGPYVAGRVIDLSLAAAQSIGMTGRGIVPVNVTVLGR